ncbi:hypothetical protein SODALDRAFT_361757 [Sodiomyces alkalinus F11]|uniref:Uncharacterized protein n=1 Tax=Sodiomyces alkalinus (strain CBS 110278 / VKM F-3762 / F11) TaxID=1314773 RepID=A0A3N2PQY9_SODAK|nr:hypothetical protein SODALDRAFT_361757 [Sodiomyces alkalinus F11]ROT36922.1 hypothetical protein SODALDRAFT_361757 [Sodiomyces alkalinus F11]
MRESNGVGVSPVSNQANQLCTYFVQNGEPRNDITGWYQLVGRDECDGSALLEFKPITWLPCHIRSADLSRISTFTFCPTLLHRKAYSNYSNPPQPPEPTTHNPQPTTHNPQPTTHNPQPCIIASSHYSTGLEQLCSPSFSSLLFSSSLLLFIFSVSPTHADAATEEALDLPKLNKVFISARSCPHSAFSFGHRNLSVGSSSFPILFLRDRETRPQIHTVFYFHPTRLHAPGLDRYSKLRDCRCGCLPLSTPPCSIVRLFSSLFAPRSSSFAPRPSRIVLRPSVHLESPLISSCLLRLGARDFPLLPPEPIGFLRRMTSTP